MKAILTAVVLSIFLSGCAVLQGDASQSFVVQYTTMKLIEESDNVEAIDVINTTQKVRDIIEEDESITMTALGAGFRQRVDISSLPASDQLLINAIISRVESTITPTVSSNKGFLSREQEITLLQLLEAIDEAAFVYIR